MYHVSNDIRLFKIFNVIGASRSEITDARKLYNTFCVPIFFVSKVAQLAPTFSLIVKTESELNDRSNKCVISRLVAIKIRSEYVWHVAPMTEEMTPIDTCETRCSRLP